MAETTKEIIHDMLRDIKPFLTKYDVKEWAILIHASTINNFINKWHKFFKNDDLKAVEYTLHIGSKCYEMFLVDVPIDIYDSSDEIKMKLWPAIRNSQFSFPWEEEPTLFINVESFNVMEEFIRIHDLQAYILKIEKKPAITWNDGIIKVVTFSESINEKFDQEDLIQTFEDHLEDYEDIKLPNYYYMVQAFDWLQPYLREFFEIPVSDYCYSVFPIILNHLRTLNYINELNIFDLLSIRLALCDELNPSPSHHFKFDIDSILKRELAKIVRNNHLDLDQYFIDSNCKRKNPLVGYLVYEFQHLFETVKKQNISKTLEMYEYQSTCMTIKLADECEVLNIIKQKTNIEFDIDGSSYDRMSLSLFLDLVECHNVREIQLDTNYRWVKDECNLNRSRSYLNGIEVELTGTNIYNFIEEFISSLKSVKFREGSADIHLRIHSKINDYTVFDNLPVNGIKLFNVKINTHILQDLHKCYRKSRIYFVGGCTFENTRQNWALLNNLGRINVTINEDEGTWLSLFEFILDEMLKTNAKEFQFDHTNCLINIIGQSFLTLEYFKFTFDELKCKLEIRRRRNNEIIDLFEEKCRLQDDIITTDDKSEYDFYQ